MKSQLNYGASSSKKPGSLRPTRFAIRRRWIRKLRAGTYASPNPLYFARMFLLTLMQGELTVEKSILRKASQIMQRVS